MNYDRFASCYDEVMDDYSWCDHFIRSMIDTRITRRRAVLELGCGTGRILELAAPLFERSTGIDLSPAMLTHARERLPNSSFHLQDMRTFSLSEHFDLILCLYDTINHLTSFDQWQQCFSRMASHLAPGGLCIIDMNTPQRLGRLSLFPPTVRTVAADDTMIMESLKMMGLLDSTTSLRRSSNIPQRISIGNSRYASMSMLLRLSRSMLH